MERTLVILDLNGVLVERVHMSKQKFLKTEYTFLTPNGYYVFVRPYTKRLLTFLFKHFDVAVWSSMNKQNTMFVVERVFNKKQRESLRFVYTQSQCDIHESMEKLYYYKRISKITKNFNYHEDHILLVDDSPNKAVFNPSYTAIHPKTYVHTRRRSDRALFKLQLVLEAFMNDPETKITHFLKSNPALTKVRLETNKPLSIWGRIIRFFSRKNVHSN